MTDKIIPEAVIVAAKRGFIRTTARRMRRDACQGSA